LVLGIFWSKGKKGACEARRKQFKSGGGGGPNLHVIYNDQQKNNKQTIKQKKYKKGEGIVPGNH
jgi:hypothetical protein